jgi:cytochrome c oxidase accessory protein FixG
MRDYPQPADVRGRFDRVRKVLFLGLIAFWAALPWVKIKGNPALFLDVDHRRFYLFGGTFNAQDIWLVFFLVTGVGFSLVYATALFGRAWCGYACPQTVFLEAFYRRVQRWIQGPREARLKLHKAPYTWEKIWKIGLTQVAYVALSFVVAHIFLSYFVSMPGVLVMVRGAPGSHPEAFAWAMAMTGLFYFNFGWFREQMCLILCPYGRLQSVLVDADTVTVMYDERRGEPRALGKAKKEGSGDCVDCKRCMVVCPTNIDIRSGLQIDCIGCTQCVDACDEIMDKVGRPRGLIRYASTSEVQGEKTKWVRPRTIIYTVLYAVGIAVATFAMSRHDDFEANILRLPGPPYSVDQGTLRDGFELHVVNKTSTARSFTISPMPASNVTFVVPMPTFELGAMESKRIPLFANMPVADYAKDVPIQIKVVPDGAEGKVVGATFIGGTR